MIPRFKPALGFDELKACLSFPKKDDVKHFENAFADLMGQKYALAFPYGRTGLMLLLEALGLKNKEIICPAYTCVVVPHAIVYSNNIPVFVDCKPDGFNMDLDQVVKKINPRTGAIIATSLFGYPADLDRLDKIRFRHPHIHIIQDCAHSFAAEWQGRSVQKEGVAAIFGLNISKILTSVFGGMVTTDDAALYQRLKAQRGRRLKRVTWIKGMRRLVYFILVYPIFLESVYGIINQLEKKGLLDYFVQYYDESKIDMPKNYLQPMMPIEARIGNVNILRYRRVVANHRAASQYYFNNLVDTADFKLPPRVLGATYSHFVVQVANRRYWLQNGIAMGVQLGSLIEYNIPEMEAYGTRSPEEYPVSSNYSRMSINLPVWGGERIAKKVVRRLSEMLPVKAR